MMSRLRRVLQLMVVEAIIGGIAVAIVIVAASLSVETFTFVYQGF